jgi:hypothetical protein
MQRMTGGFQARALLRALAIACLGVPAVLAGDPVHALAWLALAAPAAGALAAGGGIAAFGATLAIPGSWMMLLVFADLGSPVDLPRPLWAGLVLLGLTWIGWALGALVRGPSWRAGGVLLLLSALFTGLPALGGLARAPWPPALAARALDLSPVVFAEECAGVDWMRHAAVYDPVGTHTIGPELRLPWRGRLAGTGLLLVGFLAAALVRRTRVRPGLDREDRSWHFASSSAPSRKS